MVGVRQISLLRLGERPWHRRTIVPSGCPRRLLEECHLLSPPPKSDRSTALAGFGESAPDRHMRFQTQQMLIENPALHQTVGGNAPETAEPAAKRPPQGGVRPLPLKKCGLAHSPPRKAGDHHNKRTPRSLPADRWSAIWGAGDSRLSRPFVRGIQLHCNGVCIDIRRHPPS